MADLQAILERQTEKVDELRQMAETQPTVASLQALSSIYRDRGDTYAALGRHDEALEDRQAASGLLAQLVLGAGRDDLLDVLIEGGEKLRESLRATGREDEAADHELGETQLLTSTGQAARAAAVLRRLVDQRRAEYEKEKSFERLDRLVKTLSVLGGTLFQSKRIDEALEAETAAVDAVAAFQPPQESYLHALRTNRALTRAGAGQVDAAFAELDEVMKAQEALLASGGGLEVLAAAIDTRLRRAQLLMQTGKMEEGLKSLEETVAFAEKHAPAGNADAAALFRQTLRAHADAARVAGRNDEALRSAERWYGLVEAAMQAGGDPSLAAELMEAAQERAILYLAAARHDEALQEAQRLLATWGQIAQQQPEQLEVHQRMLGALELRERALAGLGRHEEAVADQSMLLQSYQQLLQQGAPPEMIQGLLVVLQRRSDSLRKLGRTIEAEQDLATLRALVSRLRGEPEGAPGTKGPGLGGPGPGPGPGGKPPGGGGLII